MSIFAKIRIFIEDTMEEMRKCSWPSREQLLESTLLVLVTMVAVSLFVFGIDQLLSWLITFLISF
jgi:preprotein translocase subunit SecE